MDPGKIGKEDLQDVKMDVSDEGPEEVVLDSQSDDSSGEGDLQEILRTYGDAHLRSRLNRQPDVIDLTKDESDDFEDDDVMAMSAEPSSAPSAAPQAMDDDDLPEVIEVMPKPKPAEEIAEECKKKGNDHFKIGEYYQALEMYSKAIEAMPTEASYYGNRSACNMMLKRYKEALADIRLSLQMDPGYEKGYLRLIRTTLALGNVKECELAFESGEKVGVKKDAKSEFERLQWLKKQLVEIDSTKKKKDYRKLIFLISQALEVASADNDLKMMKADALVRLGRLAEAQELCTEVLQNDRMCVEGLYIRAICLFLDDSIDKSMQFVRQALQYAPDNNSYRLLLKTLRQVKELREGACAKFSANKLDEAKEEYSQCLSVVKGGEFQNITIESKLYFNLALIALRQNKLDDSVGHCNKAIELNSNYLKAIIHRARVYIRKEMFDDAVHDFEAALRIDSSLKDLKRELADAKLSAKKAKRKDYYKILNVDKNATEDEIRKAYKKRAMIHHPDRHASATEAVQKDQERLFKDLREAYEVLSDSKKRFRYDQGVDLMEDQGCGPSPYDTSDLFNVFFANGGIPSFRPGQTAGNRGHHQFHSTFRH